MMVFAIVVLGVSITLRNPMFRDTLRYSMQGAALIVLFAALFIGTRNVASVHFLEKPILKWMGRMSYGAYLWHLEIGAGVEHLMGIAPQTSPSITAALMALALVALSFGAAWLSYVVFQRPVGALRHRFGAMRPPVEMTLGDAMPEVHQGVQTWSP